MQPLANALSHAASATHPRRLLAALLLPAAVIALLSWFAPPQMTFVVTDATERVWPVACALLASLATAGLVACVLTDEGRLDTVRLWLAMLPTILLSGYVVAVGAGIQPWIMAAIFVVILTAGLWFAAGRNKLLSPDKYPAIRLRTALTLSMVLFGCTAAATAYSPFAFSRAVGTLVLLSVFLAVLSVVALGMALRKRFALVVAAWGALALMFGQNDHTIPAVAAKAPGSDLSTVFAEWLTSRKDLAEFREAGLPYPVFLVSSEGGGIYAAAHAYGTLSTIASHCPTFAQHTFALVGVSGGAVGNVLFASSLGAEQRDYAPCGPSGAKVDPTPVTTDHLSPVVARMLFLESLDLFVPGQWIGRDRAKMLTDSVLSVAPDQQFAGSAITDSFDPGGARPAVLAVAVDVSTGRRNVISPFDLGEQGQTARWWPAPGLFDPDSSVRTNQISLLDAAGLSARFPWITPTGLVQTGDQEQRLLADGGYFDNSGADTVLDLINVLNIGERNAQYLDNLPPENRSPDNAGECVSPTIRLVTSFSRTERWSECQIPVFIAYFALLSRDHQPVEDSDDDSPTIQPSSSFLFDPLHVLLATRSVRGYVAPEQAQMVLCGTEISGAECPGNPNGTLGIFRSDIYPSEWNLPLGWYMPRAGFDRIVNGTAPESIFDYRATRRGSKRDIEYLLYHLDRELHRQAGGPSDMDLWDSP